MTQPAPLVGIIANPASGKDIRRLVAHGSTFDNNEKINIVRRVLLGLEAAGVSHVRYMPDSYAIVARAAEPLTLRLDLAPLAMPVLATPSDSFEAARRLAALGAAAIVTLGGDGTNRVVAKGCDDVPLVPISTGTNNVFPRMVEGTLAGLAAGLVATGQTGAHHERVIRRMPRLDVAIDGVVCDNALIDVVTARHAAVGARALWDPAQLREVVLSRVVADEIGMCALGGALFPAACGTCAGLHAVIGDEHAPRQVLAPIAPGLIRAVPIAAAHLLRAGETVDLSPTPGVVALDGEREIELLRPAERLTVTLNPRGPRVVEIGAALRAGASAGAFIQETSEGTG